jgi:hypothetical protein
VDILDHDDQRCPPTDGEKEIADHAVQPVALGVGIRGDGGWQLTDALVQIG